MNNINFELYKVFYCVAKNKNITASANELFISQPAITQTIKKLEEEVGYKLFYRTKKGVELTTEGELLYEYIKEPIEKMNRSNELFDDPNNRPQVIRIGSGTTLIRFNLIKPLKRFKDIYPNVKIEIYHGVTEDLIQQLERNELDIVLLNLPYKKQTTATILPICKAQDGFIANAEVFKEYKNIIIDVKDLNKLPLLLQKESSIAQNYLNSIIQKYDIKLDPLYRFGGYGILIDFVKEGLGVGFINKNHISNELKNGTLMEIKTNLIIPEREIGIAINKKSVNNGFINTFVEYLKHNK